MSVCLAVVVAAVAVVEDTRVLHFARKGSVGFGSHIAVAAGAVAVAEAVAYILQIQHQSE